MQLITAIIQPFMLDRLTRRLRKEKVPGYTVTQVSGSWHEMEEIPQPTMARIKVEVAVNDEQVDKICELICATVSTLQEGDGILMVTPINKVVSLRTGERGPRALRD